jgi:Holliday junction DNA helicase RuvA|tara:strand:+ start:776 stop:1378 length:603 start_codon:yes stop_codon:yes gene_type:complete
MIDQIHGMILKKTPNYAVLETGGVGLKVLSTINTLEAMPAKGKKTLLLTYLHVRDDVLDLYGFQTSRERETFLQLIGISGIGPKLALTILSGISPDKLRNRVIEGDVAAMTAIPGVGAKTAKRIIVELKEKFTKADNDSLGFEELDQTVSGLYRDALNALTALGYKHKHSNQALDKIKQSGELKGELESVIKKALQHLMF